MYQIKIRHAADILHDKEGLKNVSFSQNTAFKQDAIDPYSNPDVQKVLQLMPTLDINNLAKSCDSKKKPECGWFSKPECDPRTGQYECVWGV